MSLGEPSPGHNGRRGLLQQKHGISKSPQHSQIILKQKEGPRQTATTLEKNYKGPYCQQGWSLRLILLAKAPERNRGSGPLDLSLLSHSAWEPTRQLVTCLPAYPAPSPSPHCSQKLLQNRSSVCRTACNFTLVLHCPQGIAQTYC